MKKHFFASTLFLLTFLLAGCGLFDTATPTPIVLPTLTPMMITTEIPLPTESLPTANPPTATPEATATPGQMTMINAEVVFDNYILRTGPGRLFERVAMYNTGAAVTLIGRESSNNWVLVQTSDHFSGWMNVVGLKMQGNLGSLPMFAISNAQILHGHVYLPGRIPASGIVVSTAPIENDLSASYDTSTTNSEGVWAIYLPEETEGDWVIGPNAYTCEVSNAVSPDGESCTLNGKLPAAQEISLPYAEELVIEFEILPLNP